VDKKSCARWGVHIGGVWQIRLSDPQQCGLMSNFVLLVTEIDEAACVSGGACISRDYIYMVAVLPVAHVAACCG